MTSQAPFWLLLTLICVSVHAFFSMLEMACVSFNKVRLQYWVSRKQQRAIWLDNLLKDPSKLFGTTLVCVNVALQIGSECSRQVYASLGLNPDWAPATQVFIVLIFAELAPMFAARRRAEHVAMLGIPLLYATSKVATPLIWGIGWLSKAANKLVGGREVEAGTFLTRDELQNLLEEQDEVEAPEVSATDFSLVAANIFSLRGKTAQQVMEPIQSALLIPSGSSTGHVRQILQRAEHNFVPIFHRSPHNIVGMIYPRNLIPVPDSELVRQHASPPWFVTQNTPILKILQQFRRNSQSVAVILNDLGEAVGLLTLDDILAQIFGKMGYPRRPRPTEQVIERSFPGDMLVADFNEQYTTEIPCGPNETFSQLLTSKLGHHPEKGEGVRVGQFELKAEESTLIGVKIVSVRTRIS